VKRIAVSLGIACGLVALAVIIWMKVTPSAEVAATLLALERSRAGVEEKSVDVDGFHITYLEGGSGEPLVLLHGIGCDRYYWTRVAPYLTPRFRVIAIDLPGFGNSSRLTDRHYSGADQVAYLHAIVGALGLSSFHLGGNSMGGLISARYATTYPNEVKTLWLLAPGGTGTGPTGDLADIKPGDRIPLFARSTAEVEQVLAYATSSPPYLPTPLKEMLGARGAADYELHSRIFHELITEWQQAPLEKVVAGIGTPTRIVWGENDRILPVADANVLHAAMPGSSVLLLPGIGHAPQLEAPKQVAEDYLAFIERVSNASP